MYWINVPHSVRRKRKYSRQSSLNAAKEMSLFRHDPHAAIAVHRWTLRLKRVKLAAPGVASGSGAAEMDRRYVVVTALAVAINICALAYGLGGLIVSGLVSPEARMSGPAVVAAAPHAPR
jgi:hypothetical protein